MKKDQLKIAILSVHSCPIGNLGAKDTGGMSVYIRELSHELGKQGHQVDIYPRIHDPKDKLVYDIGCNSRLIHLDAGSDRDHRVIADKGAVFGIFHHQGYDGHDGPKRRYRQPAQRCPRAVVGRNVGGLLCHFLLLFVDCVAIYRTVPRILQEIPDFAKCVPRRSVLPSDIKQRDRRASPGRNRGYLSR